MTEDAKTARPGPARGKHEIFDAPSRLARKAGAFKVKNIEHSSLDRTIARLVRNYPQIAAPRVVELRRLWASIKADPGDADALAAFHRLALDFKGEGGSFGFPLVSAIAETLSMLCKRGGIAGPRALDAVEAHITAMEVVVGREISGDGGAIGAAVVEALREAIRKVTEASAALPS